MINNNITLSLKTPLANVGYTGKVLINVVGWTGAPGQAHKDTRYDYSDPGHLERILDQLQMVGADGVVYTWQGPQANFTHIGALETCYQCRSRNMLFALMADPWICKNAKDKEAAWIAAISHPETQEMLTSSSYIPELAILDFVTGADMGKVGAAFPSYQFWSKHIHYSWCELPDYLGVLGKENANPSMKMCGLFMEFWDGGQLKTDGTRDWTSSAWGGPARYIPAEMGNTYLDTVSLINKSAPYAQIITANDSDEGTHFLRFLPMLTGIRIGN